MFLLCLQLLTMMFNYLQHWKKLLHPYLQIPLLQIHPLSFQSLYYGVLINHLPHSRLGSLTQRISSVPVLDFDILIPSKLTSLHCIKTQSNLIPYHRMLCWMLVTLPPLGNLIVIQHQFLVRDSLGKLYTWILFLGRMYHWATFIMVCYLPTDTVIWPTYTPYRT